MTKTDMTSDSYTCSGTGGVAALECRVTSRATVREREVGRERERERWREREGTEGVRECGGKERKRCVSWGGV